MAHLLEQILGHLFGKAFEEYLGIGAMFAYTGIFFALWSWEYARRSIAKQRRVDAIICVLIGALVFVAVFYFWQGSVWKLLMAVALGLAMYFGWLVTDQKRRKGNQQ